MRILLLTSCANNDKSSGWLVFSKFIRHFKLVHGELVKIICFTPALFPSRRTLGEKTISTILRGKIITSILNRISRKYNFWISALYARIYWKKVLRIIEKENIERLWVDTDVLTMLILKRILNNIKIPYHISIFDDPFTNRFYEPFIKQFEPTLKELFYQAKSIDTPTLLLSTYYRSTGIITNECIIAESLVGTFKLPSKKAVINKKIFRIALAGSIYGIDALSIFLEAISDKISSKEVEFHLRTNVPKLYLKYIEKYYPVVAKNITLKSFISENDLVEKLQEYDILYLPMMFDEKYRFKTNTSFPSKTHNYLASGVPIIVHTPEFSSLDQFFKMNKIGCIINTLDIEEIKNLFNSVQSFEYRIDQSKRIMAFNSEMANNKHVDTLLEVLRT